MVNEETTAAFGFTESISATGGTNLALFPGSRFLVRNAVEDDPRDFIDSLYKNPFPECVELNVADMTGHDWPQDPYSKGAWAVLAAGQLTGAVDAIIERGRISDRVILASADFAQGWGGYTDRTIILMVNSLNTMSPIFLEIFPPYAT
jgi:monoamine oxidase